MRVQSKLLSLAYALRLRSQGKLILVTVLSNKCLRLTSSLILRRGRVPSVSERVACLVCTAQVDLGVVRTKGQMPV